MLGRYVYRESGPPLQEFTARPPAAAAGTAFTVVELRVHDNWGPPRVHLPVPVQSPRPARHGGDDRGRPGKPVVVSAPVKKRS